MNRTQTVAFVLPAVMCAGCVESTPALRSQPSVVDSAGIEIVTNTPAGMEMTEAWSLSGKPVIAIGAGAAPKTPLFHVAAVTPLSDGRVGVGTNTPPRALVFDSAGTLVAALGGAGEGPGEFGSVASIVPLAADSLGVWDADRRRLSVFTGDGVFARDVDLTGLAPGRSPNVLVPGGTSALLATGDGDLVLFGIGIFDQERGVKRPKSPTYRITSGGEQLAQLGSFPGMATYLGPAGGAFVPFGAMSCGSAGGGKVVIGTADETELLVYGAPGSLERIVRWPDHDRTVGGPFLARWSQLLDKWLQTQAPVQRDRLREYANRLPKAKQFPAYEGVIVADDGTIWVGEYPGPVGAGMARQLIRTPSRHWQVFGPDGAAVAAIPMPEGFQPSAVHDGLVWGVHTDEMDVESVRAYQIEHP
jgi:hypothetical protein